MHEKHLKDLIQFHSINSSNSVATTFKEFITKALDFKASLCLLKPIIEVI